MLIKTFLFIVYALMADLRGQQKDGAPAHLYPDVCIAPPLELMLVT